MRKPQKDITQEQLEQLRQQIQEWRKARKGPGPIPEELWSGAVALAKAFGVCPIARALPLDYTLGVICMNRALSWTPSLHFHRSGLYPPELTP